MDDLWTDLALYLCCLVVGGLLVGVTGAVCFGLGRRYERLAQLARHQQQGVQLELERATLLHSAMVQSEDYSALDRAG